MKDVKRQSNSTAFFIVLFSYILRRNENHYFITSIPYPFTLPNVIPRIMYLESSR